MNHKEFVSSNLPLIRMLTGIMAGYLLLQVDHVTMDAVVAAAYLPILIGNFTEEYER